MSNDDRDGELDEILELVKENNKILRKMHRAQIWSGIFRLMYWAVIIGTTVGLWYYFQPTINRYMGTYETLMERVDQLSGGVGEGVGNLQELLNNPILQR